MPLTWDCLDIHQLTGMSRDIPGCPSWDCIPLVGMFRDSMGHNRICWMWDCLDIHQLTGMSLDIPGCPSWDYIPLTRKSQDVPGHPGTQ